MLYLESNNRSREKNLSRFGRKFFLSQSYFASDQMQTSLYHTIYAARQVPLISV